MAVESVVRNAQKTLIKTRLSDSALVAAGQEDCLALRIESVGEAPRRSIDRKAQFLHICMVGTFERIRVRSPKQRPMLAED